MKKVSFIKGKMYVEEDMEILDPSTQNAYFNYIGGQERWHCTQSFTAEITVKIVPYEQ